MGLTGSGRQFGQNGQKLHDNLKINIFGSKQWGTSQFLGRESPVRHDTSEVIWRTFWGI